MSENEKIYIVEYNEKTYKVKAAGISEAYDKFHRQHPKWNVGMYSFYKLANTDGHDWAYYRYPPTLVYGFPIPLIITDDLNHYGKARRDNGI